MSLAKVLRSAWRTTKRAFTRWSADSAGAQAAALAYYSVFSIAPMIVIAIAIAGAVFGEDAANGEVQRQLHGLLGQEGAEAVAAMVKSAHRDGKAGIAAITSGCALLVGATGVFLQLQETLNHIWRVRSPKGKGLRRFLRKRLLSMAMVLGIGFLLVVSLVATAVLDAVGTWATGVVPSWEVVVNLANQVVSFVVVGLLFGLMFAYLPDKRVAWRYCFLPGMLTALLFTVGKLAIGLYLSRSTVASSFGAAGSLAVILVWVYYSAQILFLGAEMSWVLAHPERVDGVTPPDDDDQARRSAPVPG